MRERIRFIDLFAGIGGIRLGLEQAAESMNTCVECVYTSEIDQKACEIYRKNFPNDDHDPLADITNAVETEIPDFDILLAGFPCQAFSIAGRRGGFDDTRGTLFFDVARIIKEKEPQAFLLENVKGLVNHRSGKTLDTILNVLRNELGYISTQVEVLNAKHFGVPQNRERIYIVGFKDFGGSFEFPSPSSPDISVGEILEQDPVSTKYYLSDVYLESLRKHRARHEAKGNGFGYEVLPLDGVANAIVCGGMGRERNLVTDFKQTDLTPVTHIKGKVNTEGIRRMTPIEWERLQGFPDHWTQGVADGSRYKQLGNSVAVPVIKAIAAKILNELSNPMPFKKNTEQQLSLFSV